MIFCKKPGKEGLDPGESRQQPAHTLLCVDLHGRTVGFLLGIMEVSLVFQYL